MAKSGKKDVGVDDTIDAFGYCRLCGMKVPEDCECTSDDLPLPMPPNSEIPDNRARLGLTVDEAIWERRRKLAVEYIQRMGIRNKSVVRKILEDAAPLQSPGNLKTIPLTVVESRTHAKDVTGTVGDLGFAPLQMMFTILKDVERYPGIDADMPSRILVDGTIAEARAVAKRLSGWNAGCDDCYYVKGDER